MRTLLLIVLGFVVLLAVPGPSWASEIDSQEGNTGVWSGVWNGEELTVAVVARGHEIDDNTRQILPWWRWGNTTTDAYLFYWSDDQMVDLIVDFSMVNGSPEARLYVPKTVDIRAAVQLIEGDYTLPEGLRPELVVTSESGPWMVEGLPNFNLRVIESDATTGDPTWNVKVGSDAPGSPSWLIRRAIPNADQSEGLPSFGAALRADASIPFDLAEPLMPSWPYLSAVHEEGHWGEVQPIFFSHERRSITQNWTGFHIAGMYQINSLAPPPDTNFESPFAFYRFDPDAERYANLVVRSDIWPAGDPNGPPPQHEQRTAIRMTWTGREPELWRYSLSVIGDHSHTDLVQIGDEEIRAVPYDEYPSWITSKPWNGVTFVEATEGETGSEGIYDYSVEDNHAVTAWVSGIKTLPPHDVALEDIDEEALDLDSLEHEPIVTLHSPYTSFPTVHPLRLKESFRGEYSLDYRRIPRLYFSPVDQRAHLLYAAEGLWNLGDGKVLRTSNLDGGPHINAWFRERVSSEDAEISNNVTYAAPGVVEESLYTLDDYLLYSSRREVQLLALDAELDNELLPVPDDERSWDRFLDSANAGAPAGRDPHDLSNWAEHLDGARQTISSAEASDLRATETGFRFVLNLKPGFEFHGSDDRLGLANLDPDSYVVTYSRSKDEFTLQPLSPPAIYGSARSPSAVEFTPSQVAVTLRNRGLQDVVDGELELVTTSPFGEVVSAVTVEVDVFGESSQTVDIDWSPPESGRWRVTPTLTYGEESVKLRSTVVSVNPGEESRPTELLVISTTNTTRILVILALCLFAGMAGLVWRSQWDVSPTDRASREH